MTKEQAFQDYYPEEYSVCYGCGRLNEQGLHIKSFWDGDEAVCHFEPKPYHTAVAGFVYGGLIASLIDCHATGTGAAAAYRAQNRPMGSEPALRYVTASLHVDYLRPAPINTRLELRARVEELKGRKVTISCDLLAHDTVCAKGRVVVVEIPEHLMAAVRAASGKVAE